MKKTISSILAYSILACGNEDLINTRDTSSKIIESYANYNNPKGVARIFLDALNRKDSGALEEILSNDSFLRNEGIDYLNKFIYNRYFIDLHRNITSADLVELRLFKPEVYNLGPVLMLGGKLNDNAKKNYQIIGNKEEQLGIVVEQQLDKYKVVGLCIPKGFVSKFDMCG